MAGDLRRKRPRGTTIGVYRSGRETVRTGRPDPDDYCAACGLPTSGMTVEGLCESCYDIRRPNIPRRDPAIRPTGPFALD